MYVFFEWDERKAASNLVKHGVSFEAAADTFSDPYLRCAIVSAVAVKRSGLFQHGNQ